MFCVSNFHFSLVKSVKGATLDSSLLVKAVNISSQYIHRNEPKCGLFNITEWLERLKVKILPTTKETILDDLNSDTNDRESNKNTNKISDFEWDSIALIAEEVLDTAPSCEFMLGPLKLKPKPKSVSAHKKFGKLSCDDKTVNQPKLVPGTDLKSQELETTVIVRNIHSILKTYAPLPYFEFVINPDSFAQSIENIFYVSFLVQDGKCAMYKSESGELYLDLIGSKSNGASSTNNFDMESQMQSIISISYDEWKQLVDACNITTSKIPTRKAQ